MSKDEITAVVKESWELRRSGKLREAELKLHEALQSYPENNFLEANLSDVLLRQEDTQKAKELALKVLEKNPRQAMALTVLGEAALKLKEAEEAVENLRRAYELSPNSYRAGRLAQAYKIAGEEKRALEIIKHALQENPGDSYLQKQYGLLKSLVEKRELESGVGGEYKHKSDPESGAKEESFSSLGTVFSDASGLKPGEDDTEELPLGDETSSAYAQHIENQLKNLEAEKAASQLKKIIKVGSRKDNPHLQLLLGKFLRKAKQEEEAAEAYRKARELNPEDKFPLAQETYCYRRLGKKEDAWPLLKMLLYRSPEDNVAKTAFLKDAVDLEREEEAVDFLAQLLDRYPHRKELYGLIKKLKKSKNEKENS